MLREVRRSAGHPMWVGFALTWVVLGSALYPLWLSGVSAFYSDDFFHMWMQKEAFTWRIDYLVGEFFGHMISTQKLLYHLLAIGSPPSWHKVQLGMVAANVTFTWLGYRIGRRLCGHSMWSVACAAVIGLSCHQANSWLWCAAATDYIAYAPFALLGIDLMVKRCMQGSRWLSLGIGPLLLLGLMGHERSAVMAPGLFFLAIALFPRPLNEGRHLARYLLSLWDVWVACTLIIGSFLVFLHLNHYFSGQLPGGPSTLATADPKQIFLFMRLAFTKTLLPGLLGILPAYYANPKLAMAAAFMTLFVIILGCGVWLPRSMRAWFMLGAVCFFSYLPIAIGRGAATWLASLPRYCVDTLPFASVAIALIGRESARMVHSQTRTRSRRLCVRLLACVFAATLLVSPYSALQYQRAGDLQPGIDVSHRLAMSIAALPIDSDETVLEAMLPPSARFFVHWLQPFMLVSNYIGIVRPEITVANVQASRVVAFTRDGNVRRFARTRSRVLDSGELVVGNGKMSLRQDKRYCLAGGETIFMKNSCAHAHVLLEFAWENPPLAVDAVLVDEKFTPIGTDTQVPVALSAHPSGALFCAEDSKVSPRICGVRIPAGESRCFSQIRVTELEPVVSGNMASSRQRAANARAAINRYKASAP